MAFVWEYHRTSAAEARDEEPLPVHARAVLLSIANYADKRGWNAFPGYPSIEDETGVSVSTIRRVCQRLWSCGYVDAARRGGNARDTESTRGWGYSFRVVMDPAAIARKAAHRERLSPFKDDGLDRDGWPRSSETDPSGPPCDDDDPTGFERPDSTAGGPVDNVGDGPGKALAVNTFDDGQAAHKPLTSRSQAVHKPVTAGAHIGRTENREPGTENQSSSLERDRDSRDDEPGDNPDDDDRVLAACQLLAERALEDRRRALPDEPVGSPHRWLDEALSRCLDEHGTALGELARARPDLDPGGLVDVLSFAAPTPGLSQPGVGARHLPDGSLVLPGSGHITTREPDPGLTDAERAEALEIARAIPRASRACTDPTTGSQP